VRNQISHPDTNR